MLSTCRHEIILFFNRVCFWAKKHYKNSAHNDSNIEGDAVHYDNKEFPQVILKSKHQPKLSTTVAMSRPQSQAPFVPIKQRQQKSYKEENEDYAEAQLDYEEFDVEQQEIYEEVN